MLLAVLRACIIEIIVLLPQVKETQKITNKTIILLYLSRSLTLTRSMIFCYFSSSVIIFSWDILFICFINVFFFVFLLFFAANPNTYPSKWWWCCTVSVTRGQPVHVEKYIYSIVKLHFVLLAFLNGYKCMSRKSKSTRCKHWENHASHAECNFNWLLITVCVHCEKKSVTTYALIQSLFQHKNFARFEAFKLEEKRIFLTLYAKKCKKKIFQVIRKLSRKKL